MLALGVGGDLVPVRGSDGNSIDFDAADQVSSTMPD